MRLWITESWNTWFNLFRNVPNVSLDTIYYSVDKMASNVNASVKLSGEHDMNASLSFAFMKLIMGPSHSIESVQKEIKDLIKDR